MKKRGCLIVVLLAFAFLTVTLIFAQEEISLTPLIQYDSTLLGDGAPHISMCLPEQDCSADCDPRSFPPEIGCRMYAEDEVDYADDGCYTNTLPSGYNIDERYQSTTERLEELQIFYESAQSSFFGEVKDFLAEYNPFSLFFDPLTNRFGNSNSGAEDYFKNRDFNFRAEQGGIICGNDHYWYQCDAAHEGTLYWIEASFPLEGGITINRPVLLYECQEKVEGAYAWVHQGTDLDGDSYLSTGGTDDGGLDCVDFGPFDENIGCPNLEDYQGKNREEIRALLKDICRYPTNSLCAACIHPSAPEICGDLINNDCGGIDGRESLSELAGNTPDDCNKFPAGCEQKTITEATQVRENVELDEEAPPEVQHYNVYNEQFSWTPTTDGGYCCGYGGIEDLGETRTTPDDNKRICLNQNPEWVGREVTPTDPLAACTNDWCWLTAADQNNAFHILTIKKPTEPAYDVVSNNNDWIECKDANANQEISTSGIINPEDVENANLFYCYQEGNHWSWAECQDPDETIPTPDNGMKERAPGDGLFGLKIDQTSAEEMASTGRNYLFIDLEESFRPFYDDSRIDFAGLDPLYFQFLVRFKNIEENSIPQLQLTIHGPDPEPGVERIVYYDQPVLGSAVNTPLLEANRWIQVKVPLPSELLDVEAIKIESTNPDNLMEVKNIYLSSGESPLCSGTRSNELGDSSWIQDLDFSSAGKGIS